MTIREVNENTSHRYTCTLKNEAEAGVPAAQFTALTLTLTDKGTGAVINGWDAKNILNANGVTVSSQGVMAWTGVPADHPILGAAPVLYEDHLAVVTGEWTGGGLVHFFTIRVKQASV